ncbi:MAG: serine protease [Candidatus Rokubacteria bacterium]|nr:serine protease [Candidatus Rokubacteria bacterium]
MTRAPWLPALAGTLCLLLASSLGTAAPSAPAPAVPAPPAPRRELTVDTLSVVKLRSRTVSDARSAATLGTQREGTGVVIDGKGLVLTIGYLILEAESIELSTVAGHSVPASVVAYDAETGFGLVRALGPLPIAPVTFGESAGVAMRDRVLIVGFDGVAPAYVVSRRPYVAYWEYLLPDAIYTAPATVNWQGAALLDRHQRLIGIGHLAVPDAIAAGQQVPGNLFVPIDRLKPILADLVARGRSSTPPRPWLGVYTREVEGNVIVTRVADDGPADRGPVRPGDVVVAVDGQTIKGQADFYQRIWRSGDPEREMALDVLRAGRIERVTVKTSERDRYYRARPTY